MTTEEIRFAGERRGFSLTSFDGRQGVMAHVGFDELAASTLALSQDVSVYVVDEIGKMECLSPAFVKAMRALLDSPGDTEALVVTPGNRDELPERVLAWLGRESR